MTVFCDQLTLRATAELWRRRRDGRVPHGARIALLDGPPRGIGARIASAALRTMGFRVEEVPFFAGHLKTAAGEGVGPAAAKRAFWTADTAASVLVRRSGLLRQVNGTYPRETVRLRLAKQLWLPALALWTRVLVADALARDGNALAVLIVKWPTVLPRELQRELSTPMEVIAAGTRSPGWKNGRPSALLWVLRQEMRRCLSGRGPARAGNAAVPALLTLQEDDLSADRSIRSQPHWFDLKSPPGFRTIVLRSGRTADVLLTEEELHTAGIETIELAQLARAHADAPIVGQTRHDTCALCLRSMVAVHRADAWAAGEIARLVRAAGELAQLALQQGVTAFVTCENYMLHADAMQLVGPALGIRTLSYQYSNMTHPSLPMTSTADQLLTFAPMFESRFTWPGFHPPEFKAIGYVYASSFELAGRRAHARRERLRAAGALYVIGFFDESVQRDKYGWVGLEDYERELASLLRLVLADPTVGLVVKTQFHHNMNGASTQLLELLAAAQRTGRLELPREGRHRNSVLPCDVAQTSDITIGHVFGGSASLESALAGARSVMVNSLGIVSLADTLYAGGQIVFSSMDSVLEAIAGFRGGDPDRQALGDWSAVLPDFDPFRDGRTAERFASAVEEAVWRRVDLPSNSLRGVGFPTASAS